MFTVMKNSRLSAKIALLGVGSVLVTSGALVTLAVWQSGQYNTLAQQEVDALIDADLDHITQGVYNLVQAENEAVQQQVNYNLNVARHVFANTGEVSLLKETVTWAATNQFTSESKRIQLPRMVMGTQWLGQNTDPAIETAVVDEVSRLVGETATIFQRMNDGGDMLRVATTVMDAEGKRAIGTFIPVVNPDGSPNPVIAAVLKGETYCGRAFVVDAWYLTAYEPIEDSAGNVVGMLYVGTKQKEAEARVRQAILHTKVGKTGYVYVLGAKGEERGRYIISHKGERDGEDIWENKDSDGRLVIQAIINKATTLQHGELATDRYRWQNPGERTPRWKVARLAYFEPWDWVIGISVYEDELQAYRAILSDGRMRMTRTMGFAGLMITLLIGLVSLLVAWTITHPVRRMTRVVERITGGDVDQTVDVYSDDEIGTLAQAFNFMTQKLNETMQGLRTSEEKYRGIFEHALEGLFQTTFEGQVLSANPAMARMLGYDSSDDLIASISDIRQQLYVHPEERDAIIATLLKRESVFDRECQWYRKNKSKVWVSLSVSVDHDEAGMSASIHGFVTEITDRKQAEEALRKGEEFLSNIIENIPDMMFVKDAEELKFVRFNKAGEELLGYSREDLIGKSDYDFFPKKEADFFTSKDREVLGSKQLIDIPEETIQTSKRGEIWLHTKKIPILDKAGNPEYLLGISEDITGRKHAEEALRESEAGYRRLVETMNEGLSMSDPDLRITFVNERFCNMLQYSREEILGRHLNEFILEEFHEVMEEQLGKRKKGEAQTYEIAWKTKGGETIHTLVSPQGLFDEQGSYLGSIGVLTDITARKRAEEALRESEERFRSLVEHSHAGILMADENYCFIYVNDVICTILGFSQEELVGSDFRKYVDPESLDKVSDYYLRRQRGEQVPDRYEFAVRRKTGETRTVEMNVALIADAAGNKRTIGQLLDVTERKHLESQLLQAQKLEAIGTLAGGIAHDFNNILMAIQGRASLMLLHGGDESPYGEHLRALEGLVTRGADLTKQLLGFARGGKYEVRVTDLNELISKNSEIFGRTKKEVKIHRKFAEGLWTVEVDRGQIEQVFLNLYVNAWQAMPGGGDLYLQTDNVVLDETYVNPFKITPGKYVRVTVTDTGVGMDEKTRQRIFEPFFTTRELGRGTGLGLATVYGIVKNHGGIVNVYSEQGHGTTFTMYLPASKKSATKDLRAEVKPVKGKGTILLVDDEEMIRDVGMRLLEILGYQVVSTDNGREAVEVYRRRSGEIDLVILDMIMPEMLGGEVYDRLREINPKVKVLLASGYSIDGEARGILDRGCDGFIQKPFDATVMSQKIREILDKKK